MTVSAKLKDKYLNYHDSKTLDMDKTGVSFVDQQPFHIA